MSTASGDAATIAREVGGATGGAERAKGGCN